MRIVGSVVLLALASVAQELPTRSWLAVAPPVFQDALAPLVAARQAQGFDARVVAPPVEDALRAAGGAVDYLLIVGDALGRRESDLPRPDCVIDSQMSALYRWRPTQAPTFASDALFADRDRDLRPDFPVGRIPARVLDDVRIAVEKILEFESRPPSPDDLRLLAWGCAPGYGGIVDASATKLLEGIVRKQAPRWAEPWLLSAAPGDRLCGHLLDQPSLFLESLRRPALIAAIAAHASKDSVLVARPDGKALRLRREEVARLLSQGIAGPPLVLLACDAGDFAGETRSFAEECLFARGGPVLTIAATTESHPFTNYLTGQELAKRLGGEFTTVGDLWQAAQRGGEKARSFVMERMLKDVEGSLDASINVGLLRRDQVLMYAIFGDPATRLRGPGKLMVTTKPEAPTGTWEVADRSGFERLQVSFRPRKREWAPLDPSLAPEVAARETLRRANAEGEFVTLRELSLQDPWTQEAALPGDPPRDGTLRLLAIGAKKLAVWTTEQP